jgi:hypothetical protein
VHEVGFALSGTSFFIVCATTRDRTPQLLGDMFGCGIDLQCSQ